MWEKPISLSIALYTARSILYPKVIYDQAIDVIRLIAHIEEIRIHAGKRARDVLEWNKRCRKMQQYGKQSRGGPPNNVRTIEEGSLEDSIVRRVAKERRGEGSLGKAYARLIASWQKLVSVDLPLLGLKTESHSFPIGYLSSLALS